MLTPHFKELPRRFSENISYRYIDVLTVLDGEIKHEK